jgi:NAD(P)-dependent dehydrogenase (short-subunit alcohol dehydrogenase family)
MSQQQRIALITGAGGGLGRALSVAFARGGYDVAVNYGHGSATSIRPLVICARPNGHFRT